jgi:hypothetical protein
MVNPLSSGATHVAVTLPSGLAIALTPSAAAGGSAGTTEFEAADAEPAPIELVPATVKLYGVPRVSPAIVAVVSAGLPVTVSPEQPVHAGSGARSYSLIAAPFSVGAVQVTVTLPSGLAVPLTPPGAAGGSAGTTEFEADDAAPSPLTLLVAVTVKLYGVPRVNPSMDVELPAGLPVTASPVHPVQTGLGVTPYSVIDAPLSAGATHERLTVPSGFAAA